MFYGIVTFFGHISDVAVKTLYGRRSRSFFYTKVLPYVNGIICFSFFTSSKRA